MIIRTGPKETSNGTLTDQQMPKSTKQKQKVVDVTCGTKSNTR